MQGLLKSAVWLVLAAKRIYERKWSFLGLFAVALLSSVLILAELDLLPESPAPAVTPVLTESSVPVAPRAPELPVKIEIAKIALSATIANPSTTNVEVLDGELLHGAVRYPTSAKLGEVGNVVLFGHSSYLPIVKNQAYKTFNGIQKLAVGDLITVSSGTTTYTYKVRSVATESASDAAIPLSVPGKVLTLSTCDSFGAKTDRFVVVADFVESHSVSG